MLSFVASAALGEVLLRATGYRAPVLLPESVHERYRIQPQGEFVYRGYLPGLVEDFANPVKLNRLGFHDRDYSPARPAPTTFRILVLGDSYVAAWEVPLEETFHERLEARLEREDPLGRGSYQVIAFGQGRTAQRREIDWIREYGAVYRPDAILMVFFCGNDFMENDRGIFREASRFGKRYVREVVPRKLRFFAKVMRFPRLRLNGLLAEVLAEYYVRHLDRFDPAISIADLESPEFGLYRSPLPPKWARALERTGDLLDVARQEADRLGARFVLASLSGPQILGDLAERRLWAPRQDPDFDATRGDRWIRDWAEARDVPHLGLGPALAEVGRRKVFWKHDQHLNSRGHAVVADLLYPFLVQQLPGS